MSNDVLAVALRQMPRAGLRLSAAQQVGKALRDRIIDGQLTPGTRLTEETISEALGYSRNTIRESFALLAAERLVVRETNRGVFVATPSRSDIRDLYAVRRLIQPAAVEHGTAYGPDLVGQIGEVVEGARQRHRDGDADAVRQANQVFHRLIAALAGSRRVSDLMEGVLAEMRLVFRVVATDGDFHAHFLDRNEHIAALLTAGDRSGAAAELRDYLDDAERRLLG